MALTRFEADLADKYPSGVEEELQFYVAPHPMRDRDNCVPRKLHQCVAHIVEHHWVRGVVLPPDAKEQLGHAEHSHVLIEHVVAVYANTAEISHMRKRQNDLDRGPIDRVVLPADPIVTLVSDTRWRRAEVPVADDAVNELAEPARQVVVLHLAVVGEVVQVDVCPSTVALGHVVGQQVSCRTNRTISYTVTFN